jgi:hypothetical protein
MYFDAEVAGGRTLSDILIPALGSVRASTFPSAKSMSRPNILRLSDL